jgi:hypothetical protein
MPEGTELTGWLAYRLFVRGLRFALLGFLVASIFGLFGSIGVSRLIVVPCVLIGFCLAIVGVPTAGVAWLVILHEQPTWPGGQIAFIKLVSNHLLRGIR